MTIGEILAIVALLFSAAALWIGRQARIVCEELKRREMAGAGEGGNNETSE